MDEERIARAAAEVASLADREQTVRADLDRLAADLAEAEGRETAAGAAIAELIAADGADRERLAEAERAATAARERLRASEASLRSAEVADLEARLALGIRAGGPPRRAGRARRGRGQGGRRERGEHRERRERRRGRRPPGQPLDRPRAGAADGARPPRRAPRTSPRIRDEDGRELADALATIAPHWASVAPPADAPSPGRLAHLRRRYHELGAGNPFAVEEYAEVRTRLDGLEGQERDLRAAIADTRRLIDELATMIADQFRTTFAALETAFDARFRQLFQGGFARLSLTDPAICRPPASRSWRGRRARRPRRWRCSRAASGP